jgi:hypothetical protein
VILNSTRRFFARPAFVLFGAIGRDSPYPWMETRRGAMPRFTSASLTASARRAESCLFVIAGPTSSV